MKSIGICFQNFTDNSQIKSVDYFVNYGLKLKTENYEIRFEQDAQKASAIVMVGEYTDFCCSQDNGALAIDLLRKTSDILIFVFITNKSHVVAKDIQAYNSSKVFASGHHNSFAYLINQILDFSFDQMLCNEYLMKKLQDLEERFSSFKENTSRIIRSQVLHSFLSVKGEPTQVAIEKFIPAQKFDNWDSLTTLEREVRSDRSMVVCDNGVGLRINTENSRDMFKLINTATGQCMFFGVYDKNFFVDNQYRKEIYYSESMDIRAYRNIIKKLINYDLPPTSEWIDGFCNKEYSYADIPIKL